MLKLQADAQDARESTGEAQCGLDDAAGQCRTDQCRAAWKTSATVEKDGALAAVAEQASHRDVAVLSAREAFLNGWHGVFRPTHDCFSSIPPPPRLPPARPPHPPFVVVLIRCSVVRNRMRMLCRLGGAELSLARQLEVASA